MRTAREIIAEQRIGVSMRLGGSFDFALGTHKADAILSALAAEGFSIVETGRDPVTIEACAKVAEQYQSFPQPTSRAARYHVTHCVKPNIAAAIRSLSRSTREGKT